MKKQQTATELINKIDEKVKHFEKLKEIRKNHIYKTLLIKKFCENFGLPEDNIEM